MPHQIEMDFTAAKAVKLGIQDYRIGAIYLFGARRGLSRDEAILLLIDRAKLKPDAADKLASHWLTSELYRDGVMTSGRRFRAAGQAS